MPSVLLYSILSLPSGGDTVCVSVFLYSILLLPSGGDAVCMSVSMFNTVAA